MTESGIPCTKATARAMSRIASCAVNMSIWKEKGMGLCVQLSTKRGCICFLMESNWASNNLAAVDEFQGPGFRIGLRPQQCDTIVRRRNHQWRNMLGIRPHCRSTRNCQRGLPKNNFLHKTGVFGFRLIVCSSSSRIFCASTSEFGPRLV